MKTAIAIALTSALTAFAAPALANPVGTPAAVEAPKEAAKLLAVQLDADWCASCKALRPKLAAARASDSFEGVAFSRIDYTNRNKKAFWAQAAEIGVERELRELLGKKPKTGIVVLLDAANGKVMGALSRSDDADEMRAKINAALAKC